MRDKTSIDVGSPALRRGGRAAAFTLVELLVVVGIISVVIAILLPALNKARQSALQIACATQLRQFGIAMQMYVNDNHGWLPTTQGDADGWCTGDRVTELGDGWTTPLPSTPKWINFSFSELWNRHYLSSRKIAICPAYDHSLFEANGYWFGWVDRTTYLSGATDGGKMTYLYFPYYPVNGCLAYPFDWRIFGTGGLNMNSKWHFDQPWEYTTRTITIMQDVVGLGSLWPPYFAPPNTCHGTNERPQGGNILKGDWSVKWMPFTGHWTYVGNGYYNFVDSTDH